MGLEVREKRPWRLVVKFSLFLGLVTNSLQAEPARTGLVRGILFELERNQVGVRSTPGDVYRFRIDGHTWIERAREHITGSALQLGETLEVVSDREGTSANYARLIHVLDKSGRPPVREGYVRIFEKRARRAAPVSIAEYSGVVIQIGADRILMRTRLDGEKTVWLRPDTQCLENGTLVEPAALQPLTPVYVRAGVAAGAQLEAVQIIWGSLLKPDLN